MCYVFFEDVVQNLTFYVLLEDDGQKPVFQNLVCHMLLINKNTSKTTYQKKLIIHIRKSLNARKLCLNS